MVMIAYGWMKLKSGDQMPIICDALLSLSLFLADSRQDLSLYVKRLTSGIRLFEPPLCIRLSPCGQKSKTPPPPQMRALVARLVNYAILLHEKRRHRKMNFPVIENLGSARNICAKTMMCHVCPCPCTSLLRQNRRKI